jgi:membrane-associated protease RseP (regulator of RpoE activity)
MKTARLTLLVVAGLIGSIGLAAAAEKSASPNHGYLGLAVQSVPPVLHSQLPGILPEGQGVLVGQVVKDSPAGKAGLQANDILLTYGDQKLSSPEQLVKLVRGDKPGHEVAVDFLRAGKKMSCKVTLGEPEARLVPRKAPVFRFFPEERLRKLFEEMEPKTDESAWKSFDALKLSRMDGKGWRAEIDYRSKEGKKESKVFTGTRDEIRKAIQSEKDLPANERAHLLRALNFHNPIFEFHTPPLNKKRADF